MNEKGSNIILNDFNEIIKNNNLQIDEYIQEKIFNSNIDNENKINELLNLIHDINKIVEENENKINLINSNMIMLILFKCYLFKKKKSIILILYMKKLKN